MDNSDKKLIMIPLLVVILIAVWLAMAYLPVNRETGVLKERLAVLQEKTKQQVPAWKIRMMKIVVDSLFKELNERERRLYPEDKLLDLGREIERIGKRYGLRLVSIKPDYESLSLLVGKNEDVSELPMTTEFKGAFQEFTRFMDAIPEFPFALKIKGLSLLKESQNHSELKIQLQGAIILRKERSYKSESKINELTDRT